MTALRGTLLPVLTFVAVIGAQVHPGAAQATTPSTSQATVLEKQIRDALVAITSGTVVIPPRPVELTPEGDHYLVRVPLPELGKIEPADAVFTAKARPLGGERWSLDDQKLPTQFKIAGSATVEDAPDAKNPNPDGKHREAVVYDVKLGQQNARGVFDGGFTTPTDSSATISPVDVLRTSASARWPHPHGYPATSIERAPA